jgi:predicted nucleotidyltransferase
VTTLAARRQDYARRLDAAPGRAVAILRTVEGIERVSVFGSYAQGRRDLLTDLDLLVVWQTQRPLLERLKHLHAILDLGVDMETPRPEGA